MNCIKQIHARLRKIEKCSHIKHAQTSYKLAKISNVSKCIFKNHFHNN